MEGFKPFPTDLCKGIGNYYRVYVSPIQKIEAKDLHSIRSVTTGFWYFFG
jgi:hypothetical protein